MQRIEQLLQKLAAMAAKGDKNELIDIDLMLDHVKAIYAELLELRDEISTGDIDDADQADEYGEEEAQVDEELEEAIDEIEEEEEEEVDEYEENTEDELTEGIAEVRAEEPAQQIQITETTIITAKTNAHYTPPSKDIRTVIGINDKYLFINELFGSDTVNYENTLDELNKLGSYNEAMEWMNENVLFVNEKEDNAEIAQNFYDTISTFFSDK